MYKSIVTTILLLTTAIFGEIVKEKVIGYWELPQRELAISIYKENGNFQYHVKSKNRDERGKVSFSESDPNLYLTFKGLFASEPSTMEIDAAFDGTSLVVQNYGNSMNYYTKFEGVDGKYLTFNKVKGITVDDTPWSDSIMALSKKSIEDYYLLLPMKFLDCEEMQQELRTVKGRKYEIAVKDSPNGYIQFFRTAEICLFKNRKNNTDIIAVQIGRSGAGTNCGAINQLYQLIPEHHIWIERDDLLPKGYTVEELYKGEILPYYALPRKGLSIEIMDEESNSRIGTLTWNGEKFNAL